LQPGTKIPPQGFRLNRWLASDPSEADILKIFRGDLNIAVALGGPSGGLTCRDFDVLAAYERWASSFPALASRLPTVETPRGRHVYFTATACEGRSYSRSGGSIAVFDDGELKHGGYVVIPSSLHPAGSRYRWASPPDDFPFVADLLDAGLVPPNRLQTSPADNECYTRDTGGRPAGVSWGAVNVDQAVAMTQPTGPGQRHYRLFELIRLLRSIPETSDVDPRSLAKIVRRWHRLARPQIRTKSFDVTWTEFLDGWQRVKHPVGATIHAIAAEANGEGSDRLADLCRLLQERAGDRPFYLGCRPAAEVLGVSHMTASRWMKALMAEQVIRLVTPGDRLKHRASEFLYLKR
jgi:hypothetical protein